MSKDKESIQVTIRVRPLSDRQLEEDSRVSLRVEQSSNLISMQGLNGEKQSKDFIFDSVCDRTTQDQIFNKVGLKSTAYCMEGYNCTIFAYGQTGAGKTFTMMGVNQEHRNYHDLRGLIPRTLEYLFENIQNEIAETGVDYMIKCSFVEIYNEQIIDLLGNGNASLNIRQDMKKGVYIQGVTEELISRSQEAMEILRKGSKGRHVGSTCYNEASSRSHSVFTMQIQSLTNFNGVKSTKSRHFHFIDLAGSQRTKKSAGERLKEGCSINKSLHVLSTVIGSLAEVSEGKARHINYRDSKLTFLLKDSLGGNSKTHLIANISPSWISAHETRSTLIFARKVKLIKVNKASINEDSSGNLQSLKAEIKRLKSQIILLKNDSCPTELNIAEGALRVAPAMKQSQNNSDGKMVKVLQQYVDEQLEKQTKLEIELTKFINKSNHLERGIKHFSDNQKQLRMIISIYEDKIKRMSTLNAKWLLKFEQLSQQQKLEAINQYFTTERQQLLSQNEEYKKVTPSVTLVRKLLKELKIFKETENKEKEEELINILQKNNDFLKSIKEQVEKVQSKNEEDGSVSKQIVAEHKKLKEQNLQLMENIQKQVVLVAEFKDKVEEYETLLQEAIKTQIEVEKKLEENQEIYAINLDQRQKEITELVQIKQNLTQQIEDSTSSRQILQSKFSALQDELNRLKVDYKKLQRKLESDNKSYKQKIDCQNEQIAVFQKQLSEKSEEIFSLRNANIEMKAEISKKTQEYQNSIRQIENKSCEFEKMKTMMQNQKFQLKNKIEQIRGHFSQEISQKDNIIGELKKKIEEFNKKIENLQENLHQEALSRKDLEDKLRVEEELYREEKKKWEDNQKQLISMINKKEESDTETTQKLKAAQIQIIELHEKYGHLQNSSKKQLQLSKQQIHSQLLKIAEIDEKLNEKIKIIQQLSLDGAQNKQTLKELTQKINAERREKNILKEDLNEKSSIIKRLESEIDKSKSKEKEMRNSLNDQKNQIYELRKNHEVQEQVFQQRKNDLEGKIASKDREISKLRKEYEQNFQQLSNKMSSQAQIYKNAEEKLRNEMLKQKEESQIKFGEFQVKNKEMNEQNKYLQEELTKIECANLQLAQQKSGLKKLLEDMKQQLEESNRRYAEIEKQLTELQDEKIKEMDELQNKYIEEIDKKNAQIIRYQMSQQKYEKQEGQLNQAISSYSAKVKELEKNNNKALDDINRYKSEIGDLSANLENLQEKLSQQLEKNIQKNQENQELSHSLKEMCQKIASKQNTLNIESEKMMDKITSLQTIISTKTTELEKIQEQLAQKRDIIENKEKQIFNLTSELETQWQKEQKLCLQIKTAKTEEEETNQSCQKMRKIIQNNEEQILKLNEKLKESQEEQEHFKNVQNQIIERNKQEQQRNHSLSNYIEEKEASWKKENSLLKEIQQDLESEVSKLRIELNENKKLNSDNYQVIEQLQTKIQTYLSQIRELTTNLQLLSQEYTAKENRQKQVMSQEGKKMMQEIERLNSLYENLKINCNLTAIQLEKSEDEKGDLRRQLEEKEKCLEEFQEEIYRKESLVEDFQNSMRHARNEIEYLSQQLKEEMRKTEKIQEEKKDLYEKCCEMKEHILRLGREKEENATLLTQSIEELHNQLKITINQAQTWKQRTQNLENQVKMANQRADKFRKQVSKEKQMNFNLKNLIQNSQGQINQYRLEVEEKELQYKKLLEKLARYDNERKGNATQDRRACQLLEKSRTECIEMKKKYDDQIKINKILKQELQKKQIDSSIIKERAQEYCKKQNQVTKSIQANYDKLEREFGNEKRKYEAKLEELEVRYNEIMIDNKELEDKNIDLKKEMLKGTADDKNINIINRYKEENSQLRREIQKIKDHTFSDAQQKIKLKSEISKLRDLHGGSGTETTMMIELNKKNSEIKHLQKILDDSMQALQIRDYKKLSSQSLKFAINELQLKLSKSNSDVQRLESELEVKNRKIEIYEKQQKLRTSSKHKELGEQESVSSNMSKYKAKIQKCTSTFESMRQTKDEESRSILQSKDSNKGLWGIGKYGN